jgi:hypothetical protein
MKFYVIETDAGGTVGCEFSRRAAIMTGRTRGESFRVYRETIDIPAREALRLLLAHQGGYASGSELVYTSPDEQPGTPT